MIIKIGNAKFETSGDYPIMLIVNEDEKRLISKMKEGHNQICFAPSEWDDEKINKWMDE